MNETISLKRKISELSGLEVGQDAVCFAALAQKQRKTAKTGSPYWICSFKDRVGTKDFFIWSNEPVFESVSDWLPDEAYRVKVRAKSSQRGVEFSIIECRPVIPDRDAVEGYDPSELFEVSRFDMEVSFQAIWSLAEKEIEEPHLRELVLRILDDRKEKLKLMPAASAMHHAFTGGLVEHLRSMVRVSTWLGKHYASYYGDLQPPVNVGLIVAAAVLHDIGKLEELDYSPVMASYTTQGQLIGHIVIGRDLVRAAARDIEGFPPALLLELEHAILSHHGKQEYGSPVLPKTIEALIVSMADDLDAKVNQVARARLSARPGEPFTAEVRFGDDRRRFYMGGQPPAAPSETDDFPED